MLFKDYIFIAISKIKVAQSETDKILKKYGTFIHEVDNFNINKYSEKIYLKSFDSLLDLKDTTNTFSTSAANVTTINGKVYPVV